MIPLTIESPTITHAPDGQQDWLTFSSCSFLTSFLSCVLFGYSLVLSRSFFSFVSITIFSGDGDLREVFWRYSLFIFPDSFQLLVNVSIHNVYFIGIWVTWYACKLPNLSIFRYIVILISVRITLMNFFIHFLFQFQFSENESLFQDLLLFFYQPLFGVHLDCIDLFFVFFHFVWARTRLSLYFLARYLWFFVFNIFVCIVKNV